MRNYSFSIEKELPVLGDSKLSDTKEVRELLIARINVLQLIEKELMQQLDSIRRECEMTHQVRRVYDKGVV